MTGQKAARHAAPASFDMSAALDGLEVFLQPIVDVATGAPLAYEALARFGRMPGKSASTVLAEAHQAGLGYELEAACLQAAMRRRHELPPRAKLAVNLSPDVLQHPVVARAWDDDLDGLIIEVTEHMASRPAAVHDQFAHLRLRGAQIAVDDVGTGYAGLLRLATMRPDFVKIDRTVVSGVRENDAQSAVLEALVTFSHRLDAKVIGEGVEKLDDLVALAAFDVEFAQGWAVGRPEPGVRPISGLVVATCQQTRSSMLQRRAMRTMTTAFTVGMHAITSALSNATGIPELQDVVTRAASEIGLDVIGVSVVDADGTLREIASTGVQLDQTHYRVAEYPATLRVLETGAAAEVHINDPDADPAEAALMRSLGYASLLMLPLSVSGRPIGVLEFAQRSHRRWSTLDIAHGRGLATHIGDALVRFNR